MSLRSETKLKFGANQTPLKFTPRESHLVFSTLKPSRLRFDSLTTAPPPVLNNVNSALFNSGWGTLPQGWIDGRTAWTMMFWVRPNTANTAGERIISLNSPNVTLNIEVTKNPLDTQSYGKLQITMKNEFAGTTISLNSTTDNLYSAFPTGVGSSNRIFDTVTALSEDLWSHITLVFQAGNIKMYFNGNLALENDSDLAATFENTGATNWYVGGDPINGASGANIDLLSLWSTNLTEAQVKSFVYNINPTGEASLNHLYRFNGNALDEEGNTNIIINGSVEYPADIPIATNTSPPPSNGIVWGGFDDGQINPSVLAQAGSTSSFPQTFWQGLYSGISSPQNWGSDGRFSVNRFNEAVYGDEGGILALFDYTATPKWVRQDDASDDLNLGVNFDPNNDIFVFVERGGIVSQRDTIEKRSYADGSLIGSPYTLGANEVFPARCSAVDSSGNLYFIVIKNGTDVAIRKLTNTLTVDGSWVENDLTISNPQSLVLNPFDGKLVYTINNSSDQTVAVMVDSTTGNIDGTFDVPIGQQSNPRGRAIQFNPLTGNYWISSLTQLFEFDADRNFVATRVTTVTNASFNAFDILFDGVRTLGLYDNVTSGVRDIRVYDVDPVTGVFTFDSEYSTGGWGNQRTLVMHPGELSLYT